VSACKTVTPMFAKKEIQIIAISVYWPTNAHSKKQITNH
jgi:hypothetical protein